MLYKFFYTLFFIL